MAARIAASALLPPSKRTAYHHQRDVERLQRLAGEVLHISHDGDFLVRTKTTPPQHVRTHRYQVAYAYIVGYLHARGGAEGEVVL
jgi:hypothetical protein